MRKNTIFIAAIALGLLEGGCVSQPPRTASAAKPNEADEYVWVTPTGSHIPVRMRKSELLESEHTKADQEAMRNVTRLGLRNDRQGD